MNAIIISSIIYFQSFYIYSYFINRVDLHEFDELSEIELYLENTEIVFQEKLKDIATVVALRVEDTYLNNAGNIGDYTIPQDVTTFVKFYQESKLFPFMKEDYVDFKLMIVDTMGDKWKVMTNDVGGSGSSGGTISDEDKKVVEMYVHMLIKYSTSNITLLQNLFSDNVPPFKNVSQLPIYTEYIPQDIKDIFFKNDKNENGDKYQSVILSFVPNKDNNNNNKFYFSHIVFLFSNLNVINNIYEEILSYNPGLSILKTNYLFPYEIHNPKYCINALYLNTLTIPPSFLSSTTTNYIDNCFDATTPITKYTSHTKHKHKTSLDEFISTFNLHNRSYITNNPGEHELTSIIHQAELSTMRYNQTALTQTLNHIIPINNKDYKVKKSISPLTAAFQFHHYYPINTLSTIYLIKDQGLSDFVAEDIHNEMITHVLGCVTYIILLSIASIVLIMILLTSFLNKLRTWMLTLKSITTSSDVNVKQHAKSNNTSVSVSVNDDIDIDELNELTQKVSEIIKGDIEFKPHYTKLEETENKLSIERLNLETQMVKRGNIIVKEQDIQTLLEESNCTSEITKRDLMTIKHDKFVKKSSIFSAMINDYENATTRNNNASVNDDRDKDKDTMTIGSIMNVNISRRNSIKVHHYTKIEGDYVFDKESLQNKQNILYQDYKEMFSKF